MLDVTEYHLKEAGFRCCTIRGDILPKKRSEIVETFNSDPKGPEVCTGTIVDRLFQCIGTGGG